MQVKTLLTEISRLDDQDRVIPDRFVDDLIELCEECLSRPQRFLWFVGE